MTAQEKTAAKKLQQQGIDLILRCPIAELEPTLSEKLRKANGELAPNLTGYRSLLLLISSGAALWQRLQESPYAQESDPVDSYSIAIAEEYLQQAGFDNDWKFLYPGGVILPIQWIGARLNFAYDSPLGISISPRYGLWFAFRAVILIREHSAATNYPAQQHPCASCQDKPCISACPGNAVAATHPLDLSSCVGFRGQESSACATTCLARCACPIGTAYRYSQPQIHYFYRRSLTTIRAMQDAGKEK